MAILAERAEKREGQERARRPAGEDLDSIIARIPRATQRPGENYEALMAAVAAESERLSQNRASRTTVALQSMASWIEQAEERLNETERASAERQDRMASVLSQALSALKDRLDSVESQVVSRRTAPARVEFPIQDALKALAPLSETLVGLRTDVSRLAERLEQPATSDWTPAVDAIRAELARLRATMGSLATREEISALDHAVRDIAKGLEHGRPGKDIVALANPVAALYQKVQTLSGEMAEDMHRRIGAELDLIKRKVETIAETGVDRSVIDFLSSQIVDMRQDLAHRAEPEQIERLSGDVAALGRQIADLRANQVGRNEFAALKTSLEDVCSALNRTIATQEASDVPEQLDSLSRRLDILVTRPEPEPANLGPITEQLALLTDRMATLTDSRLEQADTLTAMVSRLSSQMQAVAEKEAPSQEPLMERFDRIEQELRQVGLQTSTSQASASNVERMLHSIEEKLDRPAGQTSSFDALEKRVMILADQFARIPGEPLRRTLEEATAHLKCLQNESAVIAERAAKAALNDVRSSLPDAGDLDALKQGFVELKALQTRADQKTQQTLRAVHDALDTLVARFPEQGPALRRADTALELSSDPPSDRLRPADRLEAAVRRLHAAALSQMEEVSTVPADAAPQGSDGIQAEPEMPRVAAAPSLPEEADLGNVRASFIAAARRAAQTAAPDAPAAPLLLEQEARLSEDDDGIIDEEMLGHAALSPPSLIERIRRTFEGHRRPLLFGLAFLILAAGTAQILSGGRNAPSLAAAPAEEMEQAGKADARPHASLTAPAAPEELNVFQTSSIARAPSLTASPAAAKFLVAPETVGAIPAQVPAALRQQALSGDAAAIYEIALQAAEGRGLAQDMALAVRLFERAAQAGLPPAQERLAMLHEKGIGVPRDPKLAATWYERAAQGGNIRAMHNLGTLLASGVNGKPDYASALRWYSEAAEAGLQDSQFNMGVLLARGIGTRQDLPAAYKWFTLAAAHGDGDAARKRDEIAARLGADDLAHARASAERWRPRAVDPVANEAAPSAGSRALLDRTAGNRS